MGRFTAGKGGQKREKAGQRMDHPFHHQFLDPPLLTHACAYNYWSSADACGHTVFLAEAKMFTSAHLSYALAGINHNSRRPATRHRKLPPSNYRLVEAVAPLRSIPCTVKVRVRIMHVNFNFSFKLGSKVGLHDWYTIAYYNQIFTVS